MGFSLTEYADLFDEYHQVVYDVPRLDPEDLNRFPGFSLERFNQILGSKQNVVVRFHSPSRWNVCPMGLVATALNRSGQRTLVHQSQGNQALARGVDLVLTETLGRPNHPLQSPMLRWGPFRRQGDRPEFHPDVLLASDLTSDHLPDLEWAVGELGQTTRFVVEWMEQSTWEGFVQLHPGWLILEPEPEVQFVNQMLDQYLDPCTEVDFDVRSRWTSGIDFRKVVELLLLFHPRDFSQWMELNPTDAVEMFGEETLRHRLLAKD